jgi:hypothetical protein
MTTTLILPAGTYPIGTRTLGPVNIPQGLSYAELQLDGTAMTDPALAVDAVIDFSLDGGVTWATTMSDPPNPFPLRGTMAGNTIDPDTGLQWATYRMGGRLPSPTSTTRRARMTLNIRGAPCPTAGTLVLV